MRGERDLDKAILFVYISAQEVEDLGGWPVTRDYYGYFLHALRGKGARLIAFDLLMDGPQRAFPEFDQIFADYLKSGANVCLPMAYSQFLPSATHGGTLYRAAQPVWPYALFRRHLAGCGFSNLPTDGIICRLPILADEQDSLRLSFGAEIARQFWGGHAFRGDESGLVLLDEQQRERRIPLDGKGQLYINPIGGSRMNQLSFVEALRLLRDQPRALDLTDKLVFVGVTAPGLIVSKSTVLNPALPAPLLQLEAAENILRGCWLVPVPILLQMLLIVFICAVFRIAGFGGGLRRWALITAALAFAVVCIGQSVIFWNRILPLLCPLGSIAACALFTAGWGLTRERAAARRLQHDLESEITSRTGQLETARVELAALQERVSAGLAEADEEEAKRCFAKQQEIAELEMRLADLQTAGRPDSAASERKYDILYHPDSPMAAAIRLIDLLAAADLAVIIQGETGTGKELVANAIHQGGSRGCAPFRAVNCSALPEPLLESELFGHERGSFTGAVARRKGLFELADGGTLFLDEISETSPAFQAKLLRVLQEKVIQRLGGENLIPVNVRIIAAANRDLETLVQREEFRADLFYRLNGMTLNLPALRERTMDIPLLACHFLAAHQTGSPLALAAEALAALMAYPWPGNVRELENVLRRASLLAAGEASSAIQKRHLPESILNYKSAPPVYLSLEEQILHSLRALRFSHSAIARTARALGGRDRGTITEYFRGLCFSFLVAEHYRIDAAARALAGSGDPEVIGRVARKMRAYIANLSGADEEAQLYRGLPQKYHLLLRDILLHCREIE